MADPETSPTPGKCPHCRGRLLQRTETTTRLRTEGPIAFDAQGQASGKCFWCKTEVPLPIQLSDPHSIPGPTAERFYATVPVTRIRRP